MAMIIKEEKKFSISEIVKGFIEDDITNQVSAMNGRLNIRPAYQRQFVYNENDSKAVIDSIVNGFPINVMYWVKTGKNQAGEDMYEVLDGQQRLISICHFSKNDFSVNISGNTYNFNNMTDRNKFLDYDKLIVYICEGTDEEKLEWFERINKAGKELTKQEMRSAIYFGKGTTKAKKYFISQSTNGKVAYSCDCQNTTNKLSGKDYVCGKWERQDIYEKVIVWKINSDREYDIRNYMMQCRNDESAADDLYKYFENVIIWVKRLFPTYDKVMQRVDWGFLYNKYHNDSTLSSVILEPRVLELLADDEVQSKKDIYEYVLTTSIKDDKTARKLLNLREFKSNDKKSAYEKQKHICPSCMKKWKFEEMEGDHIVPWSKGGKTEPSNLQMLCKRCNNAKSNKPYDIDAEKKAIKKVMNMTQAEVDALPIGKVD